MKRFLLIILPVLLLSLSACQMLGGNLELSERDGELILYLADAPVNEVENIFVSLTKVSIHNQDDDLWIELNDFSSQTDGVLIVDLLDLRFDAELLSQKSIPAGSYDQIRLYVDAAEEDSSPGNMINSYIKYKDIAEPKPLFIPSGSKSGLKINHSFTIEEGVITQLILDNDVSLMLHEAGKSGKVILSPTCIKVIDKVISGELEGWVGTDTDQDGTAEAVTEYDVRVEALNSQGEIAGSTVATTEDTSLEDGTIKPAGSFKIRGLPAGSYQIKAYVENESGDYSYQLPEETSYNVTIEAGELITMSEQIILVPVNPAI